MVYDDSNDPWFKNRFVYLKRQCFRPRNPEDFGDGGAFPEICILQHPQGMGRNKRGSKTLLVTVDAEGYVVFDAIVRQNENSNKIVYSQHRNIILKILKNVGDLNAVVDEEELQKKIQETTEETKAAKY